MSLVRDAALAASDVAALRRLEGAWVSPLHWAPVSAVLKRSYSAGWTAHMCSAIRSLVGGSHWPQARLHDHGKALHDRCAHCGARGTLFHRFYDCPRLSAVRREECPEHVKRAASYVQGIRECFGELFCRCLWPSPRYCFPRDEAPEENWLRFVGVFPGWKFSGKVFVDGSAFNTAHAGLSRAGWAVVAVDRAGQLIGAMYGVVPLA